MNATRGIPPRAVAGRLQGEHARCRWPWRGVSRRGTTLWCLTDAAVTSGVVRSRSAPSGDATGGAAGLTRGPVRASRRHHHATAHDR